MSAADDALRAVARRYASGAITAEAAHRFARDHIEMRDMKAPTAYEVVEALADAVREILLPLPSRVAARDEPCADLANCNICGDSLDTDGVCRQ